MRVTKSASVATYCASCGAATKPRVVNNCGVINPPSGGAIELVALSTTNEKSRLASTACNAARAWAIFAASPLWLASKANASVLPS